jgi:hypothetical protein
LAYTEIQSLALIRIMEAEFELGMRTLIAGALLRLKDRMLSGCTAGRSLDDA